MNLRNVICIALVAGLAGVWAGVSLAEEEQPSGEDMMAEMMKLGMPGAHQKHIKTMEGEWTTDGTFWMNGQEVKSAGTCTNKMINGGRFLEVDYSAPIGNMPFSGKAILGHDNHKKLYQMIWVDTMGSGIDFKTGTGSEDGKTITLKGVWDSPMGKIPSRMEFKVNGPDSHQMTSWSTYGGEEHKEMLIIYTRKK